ncbi:hypothetical protein [Rhizobium lentis]|uniref:Uncharacterized protein n=1 Tax=Rhizobium lentis TaxID=1138194 RepID=A0A7W8XCY6_9HYPH|nr:hypothetical protein [Rhizobium lentis]MBB4574430.1 hypothetical protein [Rhizobium lentis]MBB5550356.1 hypothetical protein [Rhizobium lentis]MBB5560615.1 hypothetical protein [Rhizobium lentis]MBB5567200.1 hypothetical protein [Rhizobium lentis]
MADTLFRVHFEDGTKLDITASDAAAAGKRAGDQHDGIIKKVKRVKGNG